MTDRLNVRWLYLVVLGSIPNSASTLVQRFFILALRMQTRTQPQRLPNRQRLLSPQPTNLPHLGDIASIRLKEHAPLDQRRPRECRPRLRLCAR